MRFGIPRDGPQWISLTLCTALLAAALLGPGAAPHLRGLLGRDSPARRALLVAAAALTAALLSAAYIAVYLRGGPRIIDATSYWLEARALAEGHLSWRVDEPVASTLGRFLVRPDTPGEARAAVLFPPGYPAALALGFLAGAPLAVGPLLAAAITVATCDLAARALPTTTGAGPSTAAWQPSALPLVPALAVAFSVACAALRYHTADTMSHGLAALCFTAALTLTLRALDRPARPLPAAGLAGLAVGWLAATRPASAVALAATLLAALALAAPSRAPLRAAAAVPRLRIAVAIALGALPGLVLLALHQHAATGRWAASSQRLYYATSDGPPDCFRYGFGAGVGCLGEHGDFVRDNLPNGFTLLAAAGTTLRRLSLHLVDPLNAEPLFLLVPAGAVLAWQSRRTRCLALAPLLQIAAYAPFYFDGNYPGGGARLFADVLPVEHVLAALAVAAFAARASAPRPSAQPACPAERCPPGLSADTPGGGSPLRWLALAAALPLAGFAFRAGIDHALLRDREGGAPMFDPALLAQAGVTRGLIFVDTDHGFNLGYAPGSPDAPLQVRRFRADALDRMAWEARGCPPAFLVHFEVPEGGGPGATAIFPLSFDPAAPASPPSFGPALLASPPSPDPAAPPSFARPATPPLPASPLLPATPPLPDAGASTAPRIIEGESLWPARSQRAAWALPEHAGGTCASSDRWLTVHADGSSPRDPGAQPPRVVLGLPSPWLRGALLSPRVAFAGDIAGTVGLLVDGVEIGTWSIGPHAPQESPACVWLDPRPIPAAASQIELDLTLELTPLARGRGALGSWDARGPIARSAWLFALDALSVTDGKSVDR